MASEFVDSNVTQPNEQEVIIQEAIPHYGCCVKLYVLFSASNVEYRTSLATERIRESTVLTNDHLDLKDISKQYAFEETGEPHPSHLDIPQPLIDAIMSVADSLLGVRCFNIDILIDERDASVCLIDINDMPSYKHLQNTHLIPHYIRDKLTS